MKSISQANVRQNLLLPKGLPDEDWKERFLLVLRSRFRYDHSKSLKPRPVMVGKFLFFFSSEITPQKTFSIEVYTGVQWLQLYRLRKESVFLDLQLLVDLDIEKKWFGLVIKCEKKRDYAPHEDAKSHVSLFLSLSLSLSLSVKSKIYETKTFSFCKLLCLLNALQRVQAICRQSWRRRGQLQRSPRA